ncbi:MAG: hypothetical protein KBC84_01440, partial [Proteobacteria bacterium]|nr:hypothetical protein [Pseudomonadota bacterium]
SLTPHLILLSSTENNPSAFSSLWSTQLYSHNHNQLALAAMNSEGQDPIINEQNLRNPIALNICIRNMLDRDKRLSQFQNDPNAIKAELREIGLDLNEDELHYIVKFVGRDNPMLALKIIYAIEFKDKQRLEMRVDEMVDRHLPTLLKDVNVFEIYEFIQVAVAALRKNSIELSDKKNYRFKKVKKALATFNFEDENANLPSELIIFKRLVDTYNYIPSQGVMDVFYFVSSLPDGHLGHKDLLAIFRACDGRHGERANFIFPMVKDVLSKHPEYARYSRGHPINREAFIEFFNSGIRSISPQLFHAFFLKFNRSRLLGLAELRKFEKFADKLISGKDLTEEERNSEFYTTLIQHVYDPVFFVQGISVEDLIGELREEYGPNKEQAASKRLLNDDGTPRYNNTNFSIGFETDWPQSTIDSVDAASPNFSEYTRCNNLISLLSDLNNQELTAEDERIILRSISRNTFKGINIARLGHPAQLSAEDIAPLKIVLAMATVEERAVLNRLIAEYQTHQTFASFMAIYSQLQNITEHAIDDWAESIPLKQDSNFNKYLSTFDQRIITQDRRARYTVLASNNTAVESTNDKNTLRSYHLASKIRDTYFNTLFFNMREDITIISSHNPDFKTGNAKVDEQILGTENPELRKDLISRWLKQRLRGSNQVNGVLTLSDEAFFARATTGISTGHNVWGWMENSYLQFALYSPDLGKCVGVIQLHEFTVPDFQLKKLPEAARTKKPLAARINVSASLLLKMNTSLFCETLLDRLRKFCNDNNYQLFIPENTRQNLLSNRLDITHYLEKHYSKEDRRIKLGETYAIELEYANEEKEIQVVFVIP